MAPKFLRSRDINSDVLVDQLDNPESRIYIHKIKIAFGPDGDYTDVTLASPLPVTGTFTPTGAGFSNFGQGTPALIPVSNTSTTLLLPNPLRLFARIVNNSSQRIYIQYGINAVYGQGQPLNTNATLTITAEDLWTGQINAITNSGTVNIDVLEGVL